VNTVIERMWINQPSTSHPLHHLHGVNVLAIEEGDAYRIYFLSGAVVSQVATKSSLSKGWNEKPAI
jgi:putative component of toxin-antitoxin plasmid stabilization module